MEPIFQGDVRVYQQKKGFVFPTIVIGVRFDEFEDGLFGLFEGTVVKLHLTQEELAFCTSCASVVGNGLQIGSCGFEGLGFEMNFTAPVPRRPNNVVRGVGVVNHGVGVLERLGGFLE